MVKVKMPKDPVGLALLVIAGGIVANIATAPVNRKYNQIKNSLKKTEGAA